MRTTLMLSTATSLVLACGGGANRAADRQTAAGADQPGTDTMASASIGTDTAGAANLQWGPAPPGLPTGARAAVVSGDPTKAGPFTVRLDMPPDYAIRPHHHPTSEELRLIEGTVHLGHGSKWDEKAMKAMTPDHPVVLAAEEPHFLHAASRVVIEVQSTGPFAITYIEPKDDPRNGATP